MYVLWKEFVWSLKKGISYAKYRINFFPVIVKATNGPRYVVGCRRQVQKGKLKPGTRVALDMTTLTIMRYV